MENSTWILGSPRGAFRIPGRRKRPRERFSTAVSDSPWRIWISTDSWESTTVVKTLLLRAGRVSFRGRSSTKRPPSISTP